MRIKFFSLFCIKIKYFNYFSTFSINLLRFSIHKEIIEKCCDEHTCFFQHGTSNSRRLSTNCHHFVLQEQRKAAPLCSLFYRQSKETRGPVFRGTRDDVGREGGILRLAILLDTHIKLQLPVFAGLK